ncbi:MAG: hypothetical protein FGF53_06605 [Candidatus Brockarchaeota archaeon]|nr:hypothetical protein [Candidatus Brockarchaeota archaeon]MBO3809931.1 hypothetical protein [Candidatus Brockarchaeota archaeon]
MSLEFKLSISNPKTGKSKSVKLEGSKAISLLGLKIGSVMDGSIVGKPGVKLMITEGRRENDVISTISRDSLHVNLIRIRTLINIIKPVANVLTGELIG